MGHLNFHAIVGVGLLLVCGALISVGWVPHEAVSEQIPQTVRDNPASFRSSYVYYTGWRTPTTGSGGGYSSGK
jgi:hypothetical protein